MNRFTIHYCDSEKVVDILIDGVLPTTAFTIGASGGIIEVPYSGCASSVTIDSSVTYTIDGANHKILLNMPSNSSDTERVFNFSVVWCNGNSTDAVITQAESNGFYQSIFDAPYSGCTLVASYHGCLSSITISGVSYSIDSTNKTVTFTVPPNQLDYDEMTYSAVAHWCDGEESNLSIIQEPFMPRSYLTFKTLTAGKYALSYEDSNATVEYSLDGGEYWIPYSRSSWTPNIPAGSIILWRGNINPVKTSYNGINFGTMPVDTKFEVYGNPLSLSNRNSFETATLKRNHFKLLFWKCKGLVSARNLALTATTLATGCYENMFAGCTSLTTAPSVLPATTLAERCYYGMFSGCTSLTTAPTICAQTMAESSCAIMFQQCQSLETAPELPATELVSHCYDYMFAGCFSLNYIKAMFITPPSETYTHNWVGGVAPIGTFVKNPSATWTTTGGNGVPEDWTIEYANP